MSRQTIQADLTWIDGAFVPDRTDRGRRRRPDRVRRAQPGSGAVRRLEGMALLPGFVNAHSHAFQRGLRGSGERFPVRRRQLLELAGGDVRAGRVARSRRPSGGSAARPSRRCAPPASPRVGEFHYLHHDRRRRLRLRRRRARGRGGGRHPARAAAGLLRDRRHRAAARAGAATLRHARPRGEYWRQMDRLARRLDPATQSLGVVAHSVRAVEPGRDQGAACRGGAGAACRSTCTSRSSAREIEDAVAAYGRTPMRLLCDELERRRRLHRGPLHPHLARRTWRVFLAARGHGCASARSPRPTWATASPISRAPHSAGGRSRLGTDSNARISAIEEMRWLEYGQRLRGERAGRSPDPRGEVAATLLDAATSGGAAALGIGTGRIAPGEWADFAAVDLSRAARRRVPATGLLEAIVFGARQRGRSRAPSWAGSGARPIDPTRSGR